MRTCDDCGKPFADPEGWKNICILCWKRSKEYGLGKSDQAFERLQEAVITLQKEKEDLANRLKKSKEQPPKAAESVLSKSLVRDMIILCHPDKHKGSKRATDVTKWLLARRQ